MQKNIVGGKAQSMNVERYDMAGLTMTAENVIGGYYAPNRLFTASVAVFPMDKPKYAIISLLDEPKDLQTMRGYATAGYNSSRIVSEIIMATSKNPRGM